MFAYQLPSGKSWATQNTVTEDVAKSISRLMTARERKAGKDYRLVDLSKPVRAPRKRAAVVVEAVTVGTSSAE